MKKGSSAKKGNAPIRKGAPVPKTQGNRPSQRSGKPPVADKPRQVKKPGSAPVKTQTKL